MKFTFTRTHKFYLYYIILYLITENAEILFQLVDNSFSFLLFFFPFSLNFRKNTITKIGENGEEGNDGSLLESIRNRFSQRFIAGRTGERKFIASRPVFRLN